MDIAAWLRELGLERYEQAFQAGEIDPEVLPELTDADLRELGIPLGPRKRLLKAIRALAEDDRVAASGALTDTTPGAAAGAVADGERRQVTVLFADLSGFTRLSSELGAEATHRLLDRYFASVDDIVHDYGGRVDKHIGDGVMAVFGAPIAHDDDPERAVRTALDIHPAVAALGRELGHTLEVHVGIASGEVVASGTGSAAHREYTVTGDSVNLASRLEGLAGSGQTLVSDAVWRALAGRAQGESLGAVEVEGLPRPVAVWRVQSLRREFTAAETGPIVGRQAELGQFAGIMEASRAAGTGHTVYVRGDAGIGKTRLAEEFQAMAAAAGFSCQSALVLDFGAGKGQDAIRSLVRNLLSLPVGADEGQRADAAERAIAEQLLGSERRVFLDDLLNLPQPTDRRAVYDAMDNATRNRGKRETVAELVERQSRRHPLCLRIEDVHWADPIVLAHLAELAVAIAECPTILIMTSRLEGDPMDGAWRGALRGTPVITIDLGPLRRTEAKLLADGYVGANERFVATCIERAEGNPLFLEQLLRSADLPSEARLPGSVQSVILARMDRLQPLDKQALQAASVIGQSFPLDLLRHLIGRPTYACASLLDHYLVRPRGDDFLFTHALVRDGVYGSLLEVRRHELHRRAASWFAEHDPVLYAEHLDRAKDERAPSAYLDAARAQAASYHYETAIGMVDRGLDLAASTTDQFALTCLKAKLMHDLGSIAESTAASRSALDLAETDAQRCEALIGLARCLRISDEYEEAFAALDEAERLAGNELALQRAQVHDLRGNLCFPLGRIEECLQEHGKSLEFALASGSAEAEAQALSGLGDAEYARGRMATSHAAFSRCAELCREHGFGHIEVGALMMVSGTLLFLEGARAAVEAGLRAVEAAARVGQQRAELSSHVCILLALVELRAGDPEPHFERAEAIVHQLGARRFEVPILAWRARMKMRQGRLVEAVAMLRKALEISDETGPGYQGASVAGMLALATSDPEERRRALQMGEHRLAQGAVGHNHLHFYPHAIDAMLSEGDWDEADRYAAALEDFTRPEPLAWSEFFIGRGRALASWGRGRRTPEVLAELQRLRIEAEHLGLTTASVAVDEALEAA